MSSIASSFGTGLINVFFSIASTVIKILLAPIDLIISRFLPSIQTLIDYINSFIDLCFTSIGWVLDFLAIPSGVINLIISYFIIKYSIYFSVYLFKIVFGWFKK